LTLRRKLLTTFGALGVLALLIAAMTLWTIVQWQNSNARLQDHYERSLLVQRIRAATFRAFKEVPDAVQGGDPDARQEFDQELRSAEADFRTWERLADTKQEKAQVATVRGAYEALVKDADAVFALVAAGKKNAAFALLEGRLEDRNFAQFDKAGEAAAASDRKLRQAIKAQNQRTRQTARTVLFAAAFGTLSLVLLLAAYLVSDLFAPLRQVEDALSDLARGDRERRLPEERDDELGRVNQAFNQAQDALARRERLMGLGGGSANDAANGDDGANNWRDAPSRVTLHTLVAQLRGRVTLLSEHFRRDGAAPNDDSNGASGDGKAVAAEREPQEAVLSQVDDLLQAIARVTDFGFPLDLNLAKTDIRGLLYETLLRFHDELVRRGVSVEISVGANVGEAVVDRLKLREVLGELVRNALHALPERGGRLGLRATLDEENALLLLDVADNGKGADEGAIDRALNAANSKGDSDGGKPAVGLPLARAVVEQHGGQLTVETEPGEGTNVRLELPLRV